MWPFIRAKTKAEPDNESGNNDQRPQASTRKPMRFSELIAGVDSFKTFGVHDAALKFWLPEPAREALEDLANRQGESMSEMLRQFLFQHCYGLYAFALVAERYPQHFREDMPMFSRATETVAAPSEETPSLAIVRLVEPKKGYQPKKDPTYWVPELGKNVMSLKVWIPAQLYADLQVLARHSEVTVSQYVREIVISRLLGHGTLPKRPEMLEAVQLPSAECWERGENVPMKQVSAEEFYKHADGRLDLGREP